jgi:hypothetical protein
MCDLGLLHLSMAKKIPTSELVSHTQLEEIKQDKRLFQKHGRTKKCYSSNTSTAHAKEIGQNCVNPAPMVPDGCQIIEWSGFSNSTHGDVILYRYVSVTAPVLGQHN